ncbi:DUF3899 domain-containing protein [Exiguobacterium oxidotolerans]|uniref:DUF3899 domain-containing protein n=1 Tax=Exiguobacterium oxidotolerans TaxID=223958 RepID=A0A653IBH2_9BACL|nr:DUF3899 domain-containing protein [Exiguobacterium oxidotolerans]VWX36471.1 conserved membrane hypothetical protein [Exiguobacterium oxidotolerans]
MRFHLFRPILIALILSIIYTIWASFTDSTHSFFYHFSGGLFISGFILMAIGLFSNMSANGFFRGLTAGFKKQREARLREIDGEYHEDEDEEHEVYEEKRKRSLNRTAPYLSSGLLCIAFSLLLSFV